MAELTDPVGAQNRLWITTTEGLDHTNRWLLSLCGPFTLNECSIYFINNFTWELLLNFTNNDYTASNTLNEV